MLPSNADTARLFVRAPWRLAPHSGAPMGLDWAQATALAGGLSISLTPERCDALLVMQEAVLEQVNAR